MTRIRNLALAAALSAGALSAHAGLVNRGNGLIYDNVLDVTWMSDFNHVQTSGYTGFGVNPATGRLNWDAAVLWASTLVYGGYTGWRLPTLNPSDTTCSTRVGLDYFGTGCTGGELSHLFVTDLGNEAITSVLDQTGNTPTQNANLALLSNIQPDAYWSGTQYTPIQSVALGFYTADGSQDIVGKSNGLFAVAVRDGDVAAAVPEPQSLALVLLALAAAVVAHRKRAV